MKRETKSEHIVSELTINYTTEVQFTPRSEQFKFCVEMKNIIGNNDLWKA